MARWSSRRGMVVMGGGSTAGAAMPPTTPDHRPPRGWSRFGAPLDTLPNMPGIGPGQRGGVIDLRHHIEEEHLLGAPRNEGHGVSRKGSS